MKVISSIHQPRWAVIKTRPIKINGHMFHLELRRSGTLCRVKYGERYDRYINTTFLMFVAIQDDLMRSILRGIDESY